MQDYLLFILLLFIIISLASWKYNWINSRGSHV